MTEIGFCDQIAYEKNLVAHKDNEIVSLFIGNNNIHYILDIVPLTNKKNRQYYCYSVTDTNLQFFYETSKKEYLLPLEHQKVYVIQKNKKDVWEVLDVRNPNECFLYFFEDEDQNI